MLRGRYSYARSILSTPSLAQRNPLTLFSAALTKTASANSSACHSYRIAFAKSFHCHSYGNKWGRGSNPLANIPTPKRNVLGSPSAPSTASSRLPATNRLSPLTPIIPTHPVHSPVTPIIPTLMQNTGVGGLQLSPHSRKPKCPPTCQVITITVLTQRMSARRHFGEKRRRTRRLALRYMGCTRRRGAGSPPFCTEVHRFPQGSWQIPLAKAELRDYSHARLSREASKTLRHN